MRFLPPITLQALASFTLREHALEKKPAQNPSFNAYYIHAPGQTNSSLSAFFSTWRRAPSQQSYWRDTARRVLSTCVGTLSQTAVPRTLWIHHKEWRRVTPRNCWDTFWLSPYAYVQVWIYRYQKNHISNQNMNGEVWKPWVGGKAFLEGKN